MTKRSLNDLDDQLFNLDLNEESNSFIDYVKKQYNKTVQEVNEEIKKLQIIMLKFKKELQSIVPDFQTYGDCKWENIDTSQIKISRIRQVRVIQKKLTENQKRLDELTSGKVQENFKKTIYPYIQAFQREKDWKDFPQNQSQDWDATIWNVLELYKCKEESKSPEIMVVTHEMCNQCNESLPMVLDKKTSQLYCTNCANSVFYLDSTSCHMSYGEEVDFANYAYIPLNHLNCRLASGQGKDNTEIPQEIMDHVIEDLERQGLSKDDITLNHVYEAMKKLNKKFIQYNNGKELKILKIGDYYKNVTKIWSIITGKKPKRMTPEHEEKIRTMFRQFYILWESKYRPPGRKNCLSYDYFIIRANQLLGKFSFCKYFRLLKGPKRLEMPDSVFKKVCQDPELRWDKSPHYHKIFPVKNFDIRHNFISKKIQDLVKKYQLPCINLNNELDLNQIKKDLNLPEHAWQELMASLKENNDIEDDNEDHDEMYDDDDFQDDEI